MPRLVIIEGKKKGEFHMLTPAGVSIGRLSSNDVALPDEQASRQHAKVGLADGRWSVTDLGSLNGTKVNGEAVTERALVSGDLIAIGTHVMRFEDESTSRVEVKDGRPVMPGEGTIVKSVGEVSALMAPDRLTGRFAVEKANGTLRTLYEVGKALLSTSTLSDLLELIMDQVFKALPAQRGFLLLIDKTTGELAPKVTRSNEPGFEGSVTISRTITDAVIRDRVSVLSADAATDPRFRTGESVVVYGIRSALCVPLWSGDAVVGVIYVDTLSDAYSFTEDDLDLLSAMANQAAVGILNAQLAEKARRESELRARLARYHSPDVVEHIMQECGPDCGALAASEKVVTVLFSDIRGFTALSERLAPAEVAAFLNGYFTRMTDVVFEFGGTLDKYMGDSVMALFGAPFGREDDAYRAVRAALRMLEEVARMKAEGAGVAPEIRIGINTGPVVAGNIGSPRRMDYTVIGDSVNVAQRLESMARPGQILIGGATYGLVKDRFLLNEIGRQRVKGKQDEVTVYEVLG